MLKLVKCKICKVTLATVHGNQASGVIRSHFREFHKTELDKIYAAHAKYTKLISKYGYTAYI